MGVTSGLWKALMAIAIKKIVIKKPIYLIMAFHHSGIHALLPQT
jgi:hypothetical protein